MIKKSITSNKFNGISDEYYKNNNIKKPMKQEICKCNHHFFQHDENIECIECNCKEFKSQVEKSEYDNHIATQPGTIEDYYIEKPSPYNEVCECHHSYTTHFKDEDGVLRCHSWDDCANRYDQCKCTEYKEHHLSDLVEKPQQEDHDVKVNVLLGEHLKAEMQSRAENTLGEVMAGSGFKSHTSSVDSTPNPKRSNIILQIANRIKSEHKKHSEIDWEMIAAAKIYSQFIRKS